MMQRKAFVAGALFAGAAAVLTAQDKPVQNPPATKPEGVLMAPQAPRDIIRRSVDLVTNTVIVRDHQGQFVANLGKNDFEVYEDGVKQDLITFVLTHGGRVLNDVSAPPPPVQEGILLPPPRPTNDASGRIFLILVDDLHMDFRNTGRIRDLFKKISKELVHDGDMFAIVSTGPSSIAIDATYDRKRLDEAINKISGSGPEARRDHLDARRLAGAARSPLPRARRVLDGVRRPAEDAAGPQPAQGVHLRQQRLRLRSVLEVAREGIEPALLVDEPELDDGDGGSTPRRPIPSRRGATSSPPRISPPSCRS